MNVRVSRKDSREYLRLHQLEPYFEDVARQALEKGDRPAERMRTYFRRVLAMKQVAGREYAFVSATVPPPASRAPRIPDRERAPRLLGVEPAVVHRRVPGGDPAPPEHGRDGVGLPPAPPPPLPGLPSIDVGRDSPRLAAGAPLRRAVLLRDARDGVRGALVPRQVPLGAGSLLPAACVDRPGGGWRRHGAGRAAGGRGGAARVDALDVPPRRGPRRGGLLSEHVQGVAAVAPGGDRLAREAPGPGNRGDGRTGGRTFDASVFSDPMPRRKAFTLRENQKREDHSCPRMTRNERKRTERGAPDGERQSHRFPGPGRRAVARRGGLREGRLLPAPLPVPDPERVARGAPPCPAGGPRGRRRSSRVARRRADARPRRGRRRDRRGPQVPGRRGRRRSVPVAARQGHAEARQVHPQEDGPARAREDRLRFLGPARNPGGAFHSRGMHNVGFAPSPCSQGGRPRGASPAACGRP